MTADGLAGSPLVEDIVGEVVVDTSAVLFSHRANQDAVAVEELQVNSVGVGVARVVEEKRVECGLASLVLLVDRGVDVVD